MRALQAINDFERLAPAERVRIGERIVELLGDDWTSGEPNEVDALPLVHRPTDLSFMVVPGGEFDMGLTEDDIAAARKHFDWTPDFTSHFEAMISDLRPVHRVRVRPFLVTRAPLSHEDVERLSDERFERIHCYHLRRLEARELARSLGLRLCSEAEIEWLARDGGRFHFTLDAARKLEEIEGDSSLLCSRFGVEELFEEQWAEDDYHPSYEGAPTTSAPWMDGDACGVARGGPMPEFVDEPEQIIGLLASLRSNKTQQKARVRLARDLPG